MLVIGCDYHPSVQQIAWIDTETGECVERRLRHDGGEAEKFYRDLKAKGVSVRVGIEATGHSRWFERLLAELKFELWVGDPAQIKATRVWKQKNDRQDAEHILKLMMENRFPQVWVPGPENRDLRQLPWSVIWLFSENGKLSITDKQLHRKRFFTLGSWSRFIKLWNTF
jgi:transposase